MATDRKSEQSWEEELRDFPPVVQKRAQNFRLLMEKASERGFKTLSEKLASDLVREFFPMMTMRTQKDYARGLVGLYNQKSHENMQ